MTYNELHNLYEKQCKEIAELRDTLRQSWDHKDTLGQEVQEKDKQIATLEEGRTLRAVNEAQAEDIRSLENSVACKEKLIAALIASRDEFKQINADLLDANDGIAEEHDRLFLRLQKAEGVLRKIMECGDMRWKVETVAEYFKEG